MRAGPAMPRKRRNRIMGAQARRVLVVEDEDAIRALLDSALATSGYEVRTVSTPGEPSR